MGERNESELDWAIRRVESWRAQMQTAWEDAIDEGNIYHEGLNAARRGMCDTILNELRARVQEKE